MASLRAAHIATVAIAVSLAAASLLSAGHASAQAAAGAGASDADPGLDPARDAEARALFEAGRVAFSDGRFEDALQYFTRAYELSGRAVLLYNVGTSQDRLRHEAEAVAAFERYLELAPDAPNRREVEGRLRVLREELEREQAEEAERAARAQAAGAAGAASASGSAAVGASEGSQQDGGGEDVLASWWLWTIIGVVAAGAIAGAVIATQVETGDTYPPYVLGTGDAIAITLTVPLP